ncbi:MAG: PP2C family protein-serine/threonine phosphatase [Candidatus Xenobia bacterium]
MNKQGNRGHAARAHRSARHPEGLQALEEQLAVERALRLNLEEQARRLGFLIAAGRQLAGSLDYASTLACISRLAVPHLADWCIIDLLTDDEVLRREAVSHHDPAKILAALALQQHPAPGIESAHAIPAGIRHGKPLLAACHSTLRLPFPHDDRSAELAEELGVQSCMIVPLHARSRVLGAITLVSAERSYGPEDLQLAEDLAQHAALAIDNAAIYRDECYVAQALERTLLPPGLPRIPRCDIACHYRPVHSEKSVGGDFYDVFDCGEGAWALAIGDVRGKGIPAATLTALARYTLRAAALQTRRPAEVLSILNQALVRQETHRRSCTALYGLLRLCEEGASLTLACGGHPLPLLLRADGTVGHVGQPGRLLGLYGSLGLRESVIQLSIGDTVIFYTDGITEARGHGAPFDGQLPQVVASCAGLEASAIVEQIEKAVMAWQHDVPVDDMALLAVRIKPRSESWERSEEAIFAS